MSTLELVPVAVKPDHLRDLAKTRKPTLAVAELIWNALDADASQIEVSFIRNPLEGIETIQVADDGDGLSPEEVKSRFSSLGGSWKREARRTRTGRILHGKDGKGRFKAFALGARVEWQSRYKKEGATYECKVIGDNAQMDRFQLHEPYKVEGEKTGTRTQISALYHNLSGLEGDKARAEITEHFAPYLLEYPNVVVIYEGERLNPHALCLNKIELDLDTSTDGEPFTAKLLIIEWSRPTTRALCLCDEGGFTLKEIAPSIQAPGFHFTAYLKASAFRPLHESGALELDEMNPKVRALVGKARDEMRRHFRERAASLASEKVQQWRAQNIYPYQNDPASAVERVQRQVFDVCALHVGEYLPDFESEEQKAKKLTFRLLRQAIEHGPAETQKILSEVLDLPFQKRLELSQLLEHTTLSAVINASKNIADRLEFLKGLEVLVFGRTRDVLLERSQLHRLLAENTWVFGEEFNLAVDDQSLTTVLEKHLESLGERSESESSEPLEEVTDVDGRRRIVDLMLSQRVPQPREELRHHLVVELKRPNKKIDAGVITQIKHYAFAVAEDERFRDTSTRWSFWVVSNEMDAFARHEIKQANRPPGMIHDSDNGITIWAMTWSQIIENCRGRLEFFRKQLEYSASEDSALSYLRRTYDKYLPQEVRQGTTSGS